MFIETIRYAFGLDCAADGQVVSLPRRFARRGIRIEGSGFAKHQFTPICGDDDAERDSYGGAFAERAKEFSLSAEISAELARAARRIQLQAAKRAESADKNGDPYAATTRPGHRQT